MDRPRKKHEKATKKTLLPTKKHEKHENGSATKKHEKATKKALPPTKKHENHEFERSRFSPQSKVRHAIIAFLR
jgi:hypothetical protein